MYSLLTALLCFPPVWLYFTSPISLTWLNSFSGPSSPSLLSYFRYCALLASCGLRSSIRVSVYFSGFKTFHKRQEPARCISQLVWRQSCSTHLAWLVILLKLFILLDWKDQNSRNGVNVTHLCAAGSLSMPYVGVDSSCREEYPGGTLHGLDLLHETAGTPHTDCYLEAHKQSLNIHRLLLLMWPLTEQYPWLKSKSTQLLKLTSWFLKESDIDCLIFVTC